MWKQLTDFLAESKCEICSLPGSPICNICVATRTVSMSPSKDSRLPLIVFGHNPDVVRLVIGWKDRQRRELTDVFADSIVGAISSLRLDEYRIVPIPSRQKSIRKRGWQPTDELAQKVAQKTGLIYSKGELRYCSEPLEQRGLNHYERQKNLARRFEFYGDNPKVLLVDDVFTSGATLLNASQAIREKAIIQNNIDAANSPKIVAIVAARADFVRFFHKFL